LRLEGVLDQSKDPRPIYLGPIQSKPKYHIWHHTRNTLIPREGGAHSKWDQIKRTATSLHTFPRISLRRLYFPRFRNRQTRVGHTTVLQPPTFIYRGLLVVPKVEYSHSKPSFSDLYWLERRKACRDPPVPRSILDAFHHRIQSAGNHLLIRYDQREC